MERLYPLRHNHGFLQGKPGVAVVTSAVPCEMQKSMPALDMGVNAIKFFMMEEGMNYLGAVECLGNVPCVKCENDIECKMSGIKMIYGEKAVNGAIGWVAPNHNRPCMFHFFSYLLKVILNFTNIVFSTAQTCNTRLHLAIRQLDKFCFKASIVQNGLNHSIRVLIFNRTT